MNLSRYTLDFLLEYSCRNEPIDSGYYASVYALEDTGLILKVTRVTDPYTGFLDYLEICDFKDKKHLPEIYKVLKSENLVFVIMEELVSIVNTEWYNPLLAIDYEGFEETFNWLGWGLPEEFEMLLEDLMAYSKEYNLQDDCHSDNIMVRMDGTLLGTLVVTDPFG